MKKIRLEVERLEVASFETQETEPARGTVRAHATNGQWTCAYHCTWDHYTCEGTCNCQGSANCTEVLTCPC